METRVDADELAKLLDTPEVQPILVLGSVADGELTRVGLLLSGKPLAVIEAQYRGRRAVLLALVDTADPKLPVRPVAMLIRPEDYADLDTVDAPPAKDLPTGVYL